MNSEAGTVKGMIRRVKADHARLLDILQQLDARPRSFILFHPSFVCVLLYRLASFFRVRGCNWIARIFWHLNVILTGADISEFADIEEGLVILNPPGATIMGTAGKNLTVMACAGLGAELGRLEDIGVGPGFCWLGDDVILEPHSGVLGPVRVGNRVRVSAGLIVTNDVPDNTLVAGGRVRFMKLDG